jgi:hypothetical protein
MQKENRINSDPKEQTSLNMQNKKIKESKIAQKFFAGLFIQKLNREYLKPEYIPEPFSLSFLNGLTDKEGNRLALYRNDYNKFMEYVTETYSKEEKLTKPEKEQLARSLSREQILEALCNSKVQVVKYLSGDNLSKYELDIKETNKTKNFITCGKIEAIKKEDVNCVVMLQNGHVYFTPKIRSIAGDIRPLVLVNGQEIKLTTDKTSALLGLNHSSLSNGLMVRFAGSFTYDEQSKTWVIENTTGHYGTRAIHLRGFLQDLEKMGLDISHFSVKIWIPNPPESSIKYHTIIENAKAFLDRTNDQIPTLGMTF